MRRLHVTAALILLLIILLAGLAHADAEVELRVAVDGDVHVALSIKNLNSTLYRQLKEDRAFNSSTLPLAVLMHLKEKNLTRVIIYDFKLEFEDSTRSVYAAFRIAGPDVMSVTYNSTTMRKVYELKTEWMRITLNLTQGLRLDLAELLKAPVEQWEKTQYTDPEGATHTMFRYSHPKPGPFGFSCRLILPAGATHVRAVKDIITFEGSPSIEDAILGSPLIILFALIILNVLVLAYRWVKVRGWG